jgi:hypothetical protein
VFRLICTQIVTDLWTSNEFSKIYDAWKVSNKLRSGVYPLSTCYKQNEDRLIGIVDLFDKKLHLDQKIMVMNKQLTIWHNEFDASKTPQEQRAMKNSYKVDQALINEFDTREDDFF